MSVYATYGLGVRVVYLLVALLWAPVGVVLRQLTGRGNGTVVLCYHGIADQHRKRFAWQMAHLAGQAIDAANLAGRREPGGWQPRVCVTFDDAFANLLRNALPVMQQLEIPALVFVVPGNLAAAPRWPMPPGHPEASEATMSAAQIREAQSLLCRFGSHTLNHPDLTQVSPAQLRSELQQSRAQLQQLVEQPIQDLALPFGAYNQQVLAAAREAGYGRIFTLDPCLQPLEAGLQGRFSMSPDAWRIEFRLTCAGGYAWLRPWRRLLRRLRSGRSTGRRKEPALV